MFDRGMREPLPIFCKTSSVYARARRADDDARRRACSSWESDTYNEREDAEPEHELVYGGRRPFEDLWGEPPRDDERGAGWDPEEPSRFGRYATRLWAHLLDVEELSDR